VQPLTGHPVTAWWADRVATRGKTGTDLSDPGRAGEALRDALTDGLLDLPLPGGGATQQRWSALAALATADVTLAKLAEAHADAVAILAELSGRPAGRELWAVWAAVTPALRADATPEGGWSLTGRKPWASGSTCCTRALVTAVADDGERLFAVDVAHPGIEAEAGSWPAVAMTGTASLTLLLDRVPGEPVGGPGAYVDRPGFAHGGAGIAACWYGGAVGIAGPLLTRVRDAPPDPHRNAHLGGVHASLTAARCALDDVARRIDDEPGAQLAASAATVRAVTESTAAVVVDRVGRALGPTPLATDRAHARRVADLTLFVRQSHAERDLAELGLAVAAGGAAQARW
jgi:hypothetical protein